MRRPRGLMVLLLLGLILSSSLAHAQATVVIERLADLTDVQAPFVGGRFFKWDSGLGRMLTAQPQFTDIGGLVADAQLVEIYIKADGTRELDAPWNAGQIITIPQLITNSISFFAVPAPPPPASGSGTVYFDSTSKNLAVKDDAGVVKHGVQTKAAVTSNWFRSVDDAGLFTSSQPACGDLSNGGAFCSGTDAANLTGIVASARIAGSYIGITGVGTMTAGGASSGFVISGVTMTLGADAGGDTYYRNGSGVLTRLAAGTTSQVHIGGTTPTWGAVPGAAITFANPTASVGLSAVNGSAVTPMRSDAAPALSQAIAPTWTGSHLFKPTSNAVTTVRVQKSDGSAVFNVDTTNGRVGIGTEAPAYDLELYNAIDGGMRMSGNRTSDGEFGFFEFFNRTSSATVALSARRSGADNSTQLRIFTTDAGSAGVRMTIREGGNVGIGTTAPNEGLEMGPGKNIRIPNIKSTTGQRYACVDANGNLVSSVAACVGT